MKKIHHRPQRSGNVLVFTAFMMVVMFALLAFAVDLGYLFVVRSELQRSADAATLAGAWRLCDEAPLEGDADPLEATELAQADTGEFAAHNDVANAAPALACDDVSIGYLQGDGQTIGLSPTAYVAVRTRVQRTALQNGNVSLFFAKILGKPDCVAWADATAVFVNSFRGFAAPSSGGNVEMLPFALDLETWQDMLDGNADDNWSWNEETGQISGGSDGVLEVNLFPQGTGSPGNRGTVDIGSNNNSTNDIARQILDGISPQDLEYHGGSLEFDDNGEVVLNGDTGISAGVKDELAQIKGQPRIIPVFSEVSGPGNNATYTIVTFAGIRIMEVKLTGQMSSKRVILQPAKICVQGGVPASEPQTSHFIYSPVWLIR